MLSQVNAASPVAVAYLEALSDALRQRNLAQSIRMGGDPELAALDWGALEVSHGPGRPEEPAPLVRVHGGDDQVRSGCGDSGGGGGAAGKAISNAGASWTNGTTSGTYHGSYT